MSTDSDPSKVQSLEQELRSLSAELTLPRERECVLCYVYRMLDFGCSGHTWTARYRDLRASRATALERRMSDRGGYCDCEIFMNAYELDRGLLVRHEDSECEVDWRYPDPMPVCGGVRAGSSQPCTLWNRRYRRYW
jgi:Protein of unknown function (DUF2695)